MKTNRLNEQLCQQLNLLYEHNYIAAQLSDDASTGRLDIAAFIDGKEACWQTLTTNKIKNKKSLILST
jgi:hypothetical protein